jgi:hypothetical protein
MPRKLKLQCCPVCGDKKLGLYSDEKILSPGEVVGVSYDERKTGSYSWQMMVIGVKCSQGHVFWIDEEDTVEGPPNQTTIEKMQRSLKMQSGGPEVVIDGQKYSRFEVQAAVNGFESLNEGLQDEFGDLPVPKLMEKVFRASGGQY